MKSLAYGMIDGILDPKGLFIGAAFSVTQDCLLMRVAGTYLTAKGRVDVMEAALDMLTQYSLTGSLTAEQMYEIGFSLGSGIQGVVVGAYMKGVAPCFAEGTVVQTKDGPVPIERVSAGTEVWACDTATGKWQFCPVVTPLVRQYDGPVTTLKIGDETLLATDGHPFWVVSGVDLPSRPPVEELPQHHAEQRLSVSPDVRGHGEGQERAEPEAAAHPALGAVGLGRRPAAGRPVAALRRRNSACRRSRNPPRHAAPGAMPAPSGMAVERA